MRVIQFWAAVLSAAALCGCVTDDSRQVSRTASVSPNNEFKIIVIPVPIYLTSPDRNDKDRNSGEVVPPERPDTQVHPQVVNFSEPTSIHESQLKNGAL